ncbi:MAG TPA: hypothetical protein VMX36_09535 [Sedimentisphaerales bacterium]|nr:hypothetical protein [Sedimentisphaerales bacterium]
MRGWRTKFIFLLIVYFAGFATAIYMLAPAPEGDAHQSFNKNSALAGFQSEEFAKSFNTGMHKCLAFGKDAAWRTAEFIREKLKEMRET